MSDAPVDAQPPSAEKSRVLLRDAIRENRVDLLVAAAADALGVAVDDILAATPDRETERKRLRRVVGNTVLLGLTVALVPALVQLTKPWWLAGVGGWLSGVIGGVWIMLMFLLDGPVKRKIEEVLSYEGALPALLGLLAAVGLFFGYVYTTQPRPGDPVVCIVVSARDPQLRSELKMGTLRVEIGANKQAVQPGINAVLVGKNCARVDWVTGDGQLAGRLATVAKANIKNDDDPEGVDQAADIVLQRWLEDPKRVAVQPQPGDTLVISLINGSAVSPLRRYVVRRDKLQVVMIRKAKS